MRCAGTGRRLPHRFRPLLLQFTQKSALTKMPMIRPNIVMLLSNLKCPGNHPVQPLGIGEVEEMLMLGRFGQHLTNCFNRLASHDVPYFLNARKARPSACSISRVQSESRMLSVNILIFTSVRHSMTPTSSWEMT